MALYTDNKKEYEGFQGLPTLSVSVGALLLTGVGRRNIYNRSSRFQLWASWIIISCSVAHVMVAGSLSVHPNSLPEWAGQNFIINEAATKRHT